MKNIKFLLGLFSIVVIMVSCATTQDVMNDDDYMNDQRAQQIGNRVYVQDPFYGTVVLERDPYTGRYFDVTYGSRFGNGFYGFPYGGFRGGYNRGYIGRGTVGRGGVVPQQQAPAPSRENREETRKKVLGN